MKAMITDNILTKAGLANGSRGTITEIVLDTREQSINADIVDDTVRLQYPPSMVLIQLDYICPFPTLPGLKPGQFPIFPSESKFTIGDKKKKVTITRRQFPLTPAYAFTDHKAQGQTMGFVIVDIGCLKKFPVNQFAAYVALSRSKGRDTIRLLRDFEDELFTKPPAADLQDIDSKLARLVQDTKEKWDAGVYKYN
jgi:ATP-dependent exoDNAse (exonuclease V) alpha subunit